MLAENVEKVVGTEPPVDIRLRVGEDTPAWVLPAAAKEQASCPVVVVRGTTG
ncbi:hypothetical protein OG871_05830 [Kitasatospora sp. NBC_00374]|uniref:hypothetical protein n=1 Tax=Kitasatospora sp. NBC_00374 TaxID=2975964 RepID=UPI0030DEA36E